MAVARFITHLKAAMGMDASAPLVLFGNFEVEHRWGRAETGLPRLGFAASSMVVNRMDELPLLLAGPGDVVVLKAHPDPGYLASLTGLGLALPRVLVVRDSSQDRTVTGDALGDPEALSSLRELAAMGAAMLPHGISDDEEKLSLASGLPLAGPAESVCKRVNAKVYSRRLTARLGLRQPAGRACDALDDWSDAVAWARESLRAGQQIAVKDSYGVSGKGIAVIGDERRLDQLDRMIRRQAGQSDVVRVGLVVEQWVAKVADFNYQFTVSRDGGTRFDSVKKVVIEGGVSKGQRAPSSLGARQERELAGIARLLGTALADDGYFGVVGVDAMLDPDGELYPVVEINARNNMSTYQRRLDEEIVGPDRATLARHYPLTLSAPLPFGQLRQALGDLILDRPDGTGIVVQSFATVNAAFTGTECGTADGKSAYGRLYGMLIGDDVGAVDELDAEISRRLDACT